MNNAMFELAIIIGTLKLIANHKDYCCLNNLISLFSNNIFSFHLSIFILTLFIKYQPFLQLPFDFDA